MISLLRGLMSGEVDTTRPLLSLILLGIVDFCCILIGLEQFSVGKFASGAIWIGSGILSGVTGYHWSKIKLTLTGIVAQFRRKSSKLVIHRAVYGAGDGRDVDVTDKLRSAEQDALVIPVDNNLVSSDPAIGVRKRLVVDYSYGDGTVYSAFAYESTPQETVRIVLPEDTELQKLKQSFSNLQARYSTEKTHDLNAKAEAESKVLQLERLLSIRPDLPISVLHADAIRLSVRLLQFINELGEPPLKYTAEQIHKMTDAETDRLIKANDGDFFDACEYYSPGKMLFTAYQLAAQQAARSSRLLLWYEKVRARYALEFKSQVETLRDRFAIIGITDNVLMVPVEGWDTDKTIRAISVKLWEMAYRLSVKGVYQ